MLAFDIETSPLDEEAVLKFAEPFKPPVHPGEFDSSGVKVGNIKDKDKITAKIAEAKQLHEAAVCGFEESCKLAEKEHIANAIAQAALSPTTGKVLVIGYRAFDGRMAFDDGEGDESRIMTKFWSKYEKCRAGRRPMVGANILQFDLPFLVRRSWILGVDVPKTVKPNRWWDDLFIDIREAWLCGQRWADCESSLDVIARALNVGEKNGDGAFYQMWAEDREKAIAYLRNDLEMTGLSAVKMGIV